MRRLVALVDAAHAAALEELKDVPPAPRQDAADYPAADVPQPLATMIGRMKLRFATIIEKGAAKASADVGAEVADQHRGAMVQQLRAVVAVSPQASEPWLAPVLDVHRQANQALITRMGAEQADALGREVAEAWDKGLSTDGIRAGLEKRHGIDRRRAELIARDQVGKLNGQLSMLRQTAAGGEYYTWETSLDERVRQIHADRHGEKFRWEDPPDDGHPGMPVRCRCTAEPDVEAMLAKLEADGGDVLEPGQPPQEVVDQAIEQLGQFANRAAVARAKAEARQAEKAEREAAEARAAGTGGGETADGGRRAKREPRAARASVRQPRAARRG